MRLTTANSLQIAPKRESDAEFILALSEQAFAEYSRRAGTHTLGMSESDTSTTLVATVDGRPVGFAIVSFESPAAVLLAIAVEPKSRGLGVGQRLLAAIEQEAKQSGASVLTLATAEANVAALDLFLRAGYRMMGRLFRYYGRGQNAVSMRKRL